MKNFILQRLLDHNLHATGVLLDCCAGLSADDYDREFAIGLGSLRKTLVHVIACMQRWTDRISDRVVGSSIEFEGASESGAVAGSPVELQQVLIDADADLRVLAEKLETEGRFEEIMTVVGKDSGRTFQFSRGVAFVHLMTHGVHHRAQALNMLRQLGLSEEEIPDLDAIDAELALDVD